ncbi:putative peroxisome assembly protein [Rutstroemia sp. NJR-2017a WRK4]|nr:putative peroxisome assembly protein [Rutstroemia sp. NJR-2017a WRK4]
MTSNDFTLAQQRLAARRQAREIAAQNHLTAQREASRLASQVSSLPFPFSRLGHAGLTTWDAIRGREGTRPAFRVGQVDAELLDEELVELLKGQVGEGLKYFGPHILDDWSAEILLALRAVIFKLSVWDHDATYGASLQNLRFTDARKSGPVLVSPSKWQKALYGLFTVGGKYAWTRWEYYLLGHDDGYSTPSPMMQRLSRLTTGLTNLHSTAAFASFLVFLVNGRYRTLLDRILRLRLAPPSSQISREVSFEYLNRQLVWHAFTEFLLFVLPLVGISRWRRILSRAWRRTKSLLTSSSSSDPDDEDSSSNAKGELAFLPERTCAICYHDQNSQTSENEVLGAAAAGVIGSAQTDITNPYEAECGCVYCFVCLATRLEAEDGEGWVCLRCGREVKEARPWSGDVLIEEGEEEKERQEEGLRDVEPRAEVEVEGEGEGEEKKEVVEEDSSSDRASLMGRDETYDQEEDQGFMYEDEE